MATIIYLTLIFLMIRQTEISRTPARIARLSRWSFMAQAAADAIFFVGVSIYWFESTAKTGVLILYMLEQHVSFGVLSGGRPSLALIAPAFLACVLMVYEAVS